jgi:hypothetical protein
MNESPQQVFFKAVVVALKPYFRILVAAIIFIIGLLGFGIVANVSAPNNGGVVTR